MGEVWRLLRDTVGGWYEDRAQRLGAALAFYTLFALAPGLVILIPLTGVFLGPQAAQGHIVGQIEALIGRRGAEAIEATIVSAREAGAGVTVIAVITLVFGMWWVFGELQDALNTIWGVTTRPGRGWLAMLRERFWSFTLVVGIGFLLLVSLAVSAWLAALSGFFAYLLPAPAVVLEAVNFVISFSVITVLFAMIFKVLPDVHVAWRDVWLGAALTSLLFALGKVVIGLYLGRTTIGSAYGAAGLAGGHPALGLLLRADPLLRGRVHQGLGTPAGRGRGADRGGGAAHRRGQSRARHGASPEARGAVVPRDQRPARLRRLALLLALGFVTTSRAARGAGGAEGVPGPSARVSVPGRTGVPLSAGEGESYERQTELSRERGASLLAVSALSDQAEAAGNPSHVIFLAVGLAWNPDLPDLGSNRPPQRLQDRRGWMGQGWRYPLESPEAVTTMLTCNCRPCSYVVGAGQDSVGELFARQRPWTNSAEGVAPVTRRSGGP